MIVRIKAWGVAPAVVIRFEHLTFNGRTARAGRNYNRRDLPVWHRLGTVHISGGNNGRFFHPGSSGW